MRRLRFIFAVLVVTSGLATVSCQNSHEISATPTPQPVTNSSTNTSNSNANVGLYALDEPNPPPTKTVRVPANVMWFDTGIVLKEQQKFMITAEGQWSLGRLSCGPIGTVKTDENALLPYVNLGALVAKIGDEAFIIGDRMQMPSPGTGKLYLSINAVPEKFKVNKGSVRASITYGTVPK